MKTLIFFVILFHIMHLKLP